MALTRCRVSASIVPGSPPSPFLGRARRTRRARAGRRRRSRRRPGSPDPGDAGPVAAGTGRRRPDQRSCSGRWDRASPTRATITRWSRLSDDGVRSRLGGGPATTTIGFGTTVTRRRPAVVLVHPRFAEALEQLRAWRYETGGRQTGLRGLRRQDPVAGRRPAAHPRGRAPGHQRDRTGEAGELRRRTHRPGREAQGRLRPAVSGPVDRRGPRRRSRRPRRPRPARRNRAARWAWELMSSPRRASTS